MRLDEHMERDREMLPADAPRTDRPSDTAWVTYPQQWIAAWYDAVLRLPSVRRYAARLRLVVTDKGDEFLSSSGSCQRHRDGTFTITVNAGGDPWDAMTTVLHEIAHVLAWRTPGLHPPAWEHRYVRLLDEFIGITFDRAQAVTAHRAGVPAEFASDWRRSHAMDDAVRDAITVANPSLFAARGAIIAVAGGKIYPTTQRTGE